MQTDDTRMRTITVGINRRCPLRCRHCSLGLGGDPRDRARISREDLVHVIGCIPSSTYRVVLLTGGEPSLEADLVRAAAEACRRRGLISAMVTAPMWAKTPESARRLVERVGGLHMVILSYDRYHLEFLPLDYYRQAAEAARRAGMLVAFHMTYAEDSERVELTAALGHLPFQVHVDAMRVVAIGSAADPARLPRAARPLLSIGDLESLPRTCVAGNALVDSRFGVHACCWAAVLPLSPLSIAASRDTLPQALAALEGAPAFQAVLERGFIGALSPRGREHLMRAYQGRDLATECDLCISAMREGASAVWGFDLPIVQSPQAAETSASLPSPRR